VFGVVNRLTFAEPVDDEVAARFQEALPLVREAGCRTAYVVQTGEREAHLVLLFDSAEQAAEITERVGNPFMREHIVPLLAGPTDRRTGPVIASTDG
jgi:Antibiotic biosynthesis monooxygenase